MAGLGSERGVTVFAMRMPDAMILSDRSFRWMNHYPPLDGLMAGYSWSKRKNGCLMAEVARLRVAGEE